MLKTITKKILDKSTDKFFKFVFYCERCGYEWTSEAYCFLHGFPDELTEGEERAKNIMWKVEHDAAMERANLEARLRFNQCCSCGRIVCDECFAMETDGDLCVDCANHKK